MSKYYKHTVPEEGSMDWFWYIPTREGFWDTTGWRYFACSPCKVNFHAHVDKDTKFIKCFNCGKFKKLPFRQSGRDKS